MPIITGTPLDGLISGAADAYSMLDEKRRKDATSQIMETPFSVQRLKYPLDLTTQTSDNSTAGTYRHWIDFRIQSQEKSKFKNSKDTAASQIDLPGNRVTYSPSPAGIGIGAAAGSAGSIGNAAGSIIKGRAGTKLDGLYSVAKVGAGAVATGAIAKFLDLRRKTVQTKALISLYTPDQLVFKTENDYDQIKVSKAFGKAAQFEAAPGSAAASTIASQAGVDQENAYRLLLRSQGYAQNPALELLYDGVKFRTFQFVFDFSPRNLKEEQEIKDIIRMFRFHASPEFSGDFLSEGGSSKSFSTDGTLLIPPSEFVMEFMMSDENGNTFTNPTLPRFKQCVLNTIDVDYAPDGQFSSHRSGHPVHIRMTLNFTEVQILTKSDIMDGF